MSKNLSLKICVINGYQSSEVLLNNLKLGWFISLLNSRFLVIWRFQRSIYLYVSNTGWRPTTKDCWEMETLYVCMYGLRHICTFSAVIPFVTWIFNKVCSQQVCLLCLVTELKRGKYHMWWKRKKVGIISAKSAHRGSQDGKGCVQGCRGGDQSHSESAVFRCPETVVVADRGKVSDAWKKAMPGKRQRLFCFQARKDLGNYRLLHSKFFMGKNKNIKRVWKKN